MDKTPFTLHRGNSLSVLKTMADASVDSVVCDPPYELGFMGKGWDKTGIANNVELWAEALRVLKPGGHLLAFSGTRTYHRMVCAIEDAGFEIRDRVLYLRGDGEVEEHFPVWIYASGFPKSRNLEGEWAGFGTALKPAHEPIAVARKPLAKGCTVAANVLAHGTGALNIDACRIPTGDKLGGGDQLASTKIKVEGWDRPWMQDEAAKAAHAVRVNANVEKAEGLGRWPANIIHDGSDEVLAAFPQANGQQGALTGAEPSSKTANTFGTFAGRAPAVPRGDAGSAARFFYCAKASRADRNEGCEGLPLKQSGMVSNTSGQHITRRDGGAPGPTTNHHPTVKPTELMRYLQRLVTPPGGLTLDPFMGSGSSGKAAMLEGFRFIGIDLDSDADGNPLGYIDIARARITHAWRQVVAEREEAARKAADLPAQPDLFAAAS